MMSRGAYNPFARSTLHGDVILDDRACGKCGYSLKGLKTTERCPECGTPIPIKKASVGSMTEAPVPYLEQLAMHAALLCSCGLGVLFLSIGFIPWVKSLGVLVGLLAITAAAAFGFGYGVHGVTRPRQFGSPTSVNPLEEWRTLRTVCRSTQWLWGVTFVFLFAAGTVQLGAVAMAAKMAPAGGPAPVIPVQPLALVLAGTGGVTAIGAFGGLIALAIYLALLADWANDISLAMRLRLAPFMLLLSVPVGTLLGFLVLLWRPTARVVFMVPLYVIVGGAFLICLGMVVVPVIQFSLMCSWAKRNVDATLDRDRRASSNIVRRIEDAQVKASPKSGAGRPVVMPSRPQGNYLPKGESETGGYDLAPEERT